EDYPELAPRGITKARLDAIQTYAERIYCRPWNTKRQPWPLGIDGTTWQSLTRYAEDARVAYTTAQRWSDDLERGGISARSFPSGLATDRQRTGATSSTGGGAYSAYATTLLPPRKIMRVHRMALLVKCIPAWDEYGIDEVAD